MVQHGFAVASTALVAAVQRSIAATTTAPTFPPVPSVVTVSAPSNQSSGNATPVINTSASTAGSTFGRTGTRVQSDNVRQISQISINGQRYNGPVYDANHNRIA